MVISMLYFRAAKKYATHRCRELHSRTCSERVSTAGELRTLWHVQIAKVGPAKYAIIDVVAKGIAAEPCCAWSVIGNRMYLRSQTASLEVPFLR